MTTPHTPPRAAPPRAARRGPRPSHVAVAVAASAQLAAGCYREVPVTWQAAPSGREVDVTLDPTQTGSLAAQLGPRARVLSGRVAGRTDSSLTVAVSQITRTTGVEENWPNDAVEVPARAVERVTERRLSGARTAILGIGIAGLGALFGTIASSADFFGGNGGRTPGRQ